jgi:hypothetical protein
MADDGKTYTLEDALYDFMKDPTTPPLTPEEIKRLKEGLAFGGPPTKKTIEIVVRHIRGENVAPGVELEVSPDGKVRPKKPKGGS